MVRRSRDAVAELNLPPGFRFHPTDEELVVHYLSRKASKQLLPVPIIAEVDLYKYDPWLLPEKALFGQKEWYFFTPRDRKYPNGTRPNRVAGGGYWKATGADKPVIPEGSARPLGIKKSLVFYTGKAPNGVKTNWILHEYRLAGVDRSARRRGTLRLDDWVLCRLYNKKSNWEEEMQQRSTEEGMSGVDMMDSLEDESTGGHNSPESYVETHHTLHRRGGAVIPGTMSHAMPGGPGENPPDWFVGLNADDLRGPFAAAAAGLDSDSYQDFYFIPPAPPSSSSRPPPF